MNKMADKQADSMNKSDYINGLLFFILVLFCVCLTFQTPDGDNLFYKLLGVFRINPGIRLGANISLHIYPLIPLTATIVSVKKILKYWQGYGLKFKEYNVFLRWLPVIIAIVVYLFSANIDSIFYALIGFEEGM